MNTLKLSNEKVSLAIMSPPKHSPAVAYIKLHTEGITKQDLQPHSTIRVLNHNLHAVVFKKMRGEGHYIRFHDATPPGYEPYLRHHGLIDEILEKVEEAVLV